MNRTQRTRLAQVPHAPGSIGKAGGITPGQLADARKDLGRHLAQWRTGAGLKQVDLARLIRYSRSQIANIEVGRDNTTRVFWRNVDAALVAHGALLAMFDQVDALVRDFQAQRLHAREQERQQSAVPPAPLNSGGGGAVAACASACGAEPMVVGRWTGREVRALREALRMSVRVFAEYLGVSKVTVTGWEHRTSPVRPRLAAQSVLDQALTLADTDSRARFRLVLDGPTPNEQTDMREESGVTSAHVF